MQSEISTDEAEVDPSADQLLASCAAGDRAAFQKVYRMFSATAYGLALRVLRDEELAQDALQEAFTQVWTEASRFDPVRASAKAWIMTIVHRRAVDRVRREEADRRRGQVWGAGQIETPHDSVAEIVELNAEHRRVRSALAALSPIQRQALDLAYTRGMTQTQIAQQLDIPLGTAKTRLRDALQRLRQEMEVTA
ncbi:MAG: sigma-70 family RNA polymerase sigma factor [Actinomycetota bacterium]|nr:sigma-70 family RNA polymerase sigma factor [Actinomycetota bacterium]